MYLRLPLTNRQSALKGNATFREDRGWSYNPCVLTAISFSEKVKDEMNLRDNAIVVSA